MTPVEWGLQAQLVLAGVGILAAAAAPERTRSAAGGISCALLAVAGLATGALALTGERGSLAIPVALPVDALLLAPTALGALFTVIVSAVGLLVSGFGIGYARHAAASRASWGAFALFLAAMQLLPAAGDVVAFLLLWEAMALGSTILLLAEHAVRARVAPAVIWYAAMSQLSFAFLLAGFTVLAAAAGSTGFADIARLTPDSGTGGAAFMLLLAGFGSKAGLIPVHVWLPRAHPEAPTHASAAMSAGMVNMGVYGVLLVSILLTPTAPAWWGLAMMAVGGASAVYGILRASVSSELKVLLAYSTTENMGLVFLALGASVLLRGSGAEAAAGPALLAALLLTVSHALFKVLLFLGAGALQRATGQTDLDRLGGLLTRMPGTAAVFGTAALAAAALPITPGFVAEWVLLQALLHGSRLDGEPVSLAVSVAMPLGVATIALTAGLALLTFVKAYGIAFLARPRSPGPAAAREVGPVMLSPMIVGAVVLLALGLLPGPLAHALARTLPDGVAPELETVGLGGIALPGIGVLLDTASLAVLGLVVLAPVLIANLVLARRHRVRRDPLAWGGGGDRGHPRMQYTATSYAEPLLRVFDDVLQPSRDVQVTHASESRYLVERVQVEQRTEDVVETRVYRPTLRLLDRLGELARHAQNGSIRLYLGYSFAALIAVLVAVAAI